MGTGARAGGPRTSRAAATEPLVIGVDIGTSSTKGILATLDGDVRHSVTLTHSPSRPHPGHVEMDSELWWQEFVRIAAELSAKADGPIRAVGVSGMGPCALLTDAHGTPLRPAILYGVDTRATAQIARLTASIGADRLRREAGSPLTSQATGPKLAWVADTEPEVFARARRLFMPASWLSWRLTGAYVIDHASASQMVPLYDPAARDWHAEWADPLRGGIELPSLAWAGDIAGTVTEEASALTGLPRGVPVIVGTIDAWMEAVSVGADGPGDFSLMYGTTVLMIATSRRRLDHPGLWGTLGTTPGTSCLAAGTATSGAITNWLRELSGGPDFAELVAEAERSPAGSNGLLMLGYFAGERTPINDPDARGTIVGLTVSHTRGDLYRAALESTAYAIRHNLEALRQAGADIGVAHAVGGGTTSPLWPQIVSDVTGLTQVLAANAVGASLGAAYLAASAIADVDIAVWNPIVREVAPDPRNTERYEALYADYRKLDRATRGIAHRLAERQRGQRR
ncbi:FGGY-family carbohydrate kinase [Mycetocola reblochoni]|uniref:Xylulose kinase n=2 Tax=Mycetocola reblochoni TaxID=331618 RepID=A0A1R4K770_9MICO|nr:FGGY family carbohydrate kinase [Mycetocola reblochoni]RLP71112.1 sugar kinase [Mycetocola reblochoni]SJN40126.1 Xylulose kinase [Mycetocola reblochoni REB411]